MTGPADDPAQQHIVGPWVLERRLGVGGMAEVWLARHSRLETQAAVKFLNAAYAGHPEVEARFLDEGKLQAKLTQLNASAANILPVFDYMSVEGRSYLIMRYILGIGLDRRIADAGGPLPTAEVLSISRDVLGAMGFAHSQGVIHRDIKPSNVLLEGGKRAFLMDFGIALARDAENRRTRVGAVLGTMHYMSPEQIESPRDVTPASDIYSFGCMLYEMLTGQTPFDPQNKATDLEIMRQHVAVPPSPPSRLNPAVPRVLDEVVLRCLAKRAVDRFPDCEAVQGALDGRPSLQPSPAQSVAQPSPKTILIETSGLQAKTRMEIPLPGGASIASPAASSPPIRQPQPRSTAGTPVNKPSLPGADELRHQKQKKRTLGILAGAFAAAVALSGGIALWQHEKPAPAPVSHVAQQTTQPPPVVTDQPPATGTGIANGRTKTPVSAPVARKQRAASPSGTVSGQNDHPAQQPPPQVPSGPSSGVMVWQGSVAPNQAITFYPGGSVSAGQMQGSAFPSQPLTVSIRPATMFDIVQQPNAANNWRLVLSPRVSGDMRVTIHWSLAGQ